MSQVATQSVDSYEIWRQLVVKHEITGVSVHDARLVSIMLANGVGKILTFNERDFRLRFESDGVPVLSPS